MDQEKALMHGSFGNTDRLFARHPLDRERAYKLLGLLMKKGVRWDEAKKKFSEHLAAENCDKKHITMELKLVQKFMQPWLD